jgi:hypothetical protein
VQVQYDTFITVYKSDCDFYPRVRAAGYKTLNYPEVRPPVLMFYRLIIATRPLRTSALP